MKLDIESLGATEIDLVSVYRITPEAARNFLERNNGNRNPRSRIIDKYAKSLSDGMWYFLGDPIVFDENGVMRSGQHRCMAVIKADAATDCVVITGVPADAFPALDTGVKRTPGDQLRTMFGIDNCNIVAALIPRLATARENGRCRPGTMSEADIVAWYATHAHEHLLYQDAINLSRKIVEKLDAGSASGLAASLCTLADADAEQAFAFYEDLLNGSSWGDPTSPSRLLMQYLCQRKRGQQTKVAAEEFHWCAVRTFNAYRKGERLTILKPRMNGLVYPIYPV